MKAFKPLLAAALLPLAPAIHANEGMWMPSQLPSIARELRDAGFRGDPRDLANLAGPPMSAVAKVGGASGAFVSKDGLLLTNHHVAFGVIQCIQFAQRTLFALCGNVKPV